MAAEVKRKISAASARSHTRKSKSNSSSTFLSGTSIKFLLVFFTGFLAWAYQAACPPAPKKVGPPDGLPITTPRIKLRDGRYLSYKEYGVPKESAKYKIIYVHGFDSVKHYAVIATSASPALIEELGIYIVSFDRPGYGESDPDPKRMLKSLALDTDELADQLEFGSKFYVVGFSMGRQLIWSFLKYIPHRLEGGIEGTIVTGSCLEGIRVLLVWLKVPARYSKQANILNGCMALFPIVGAILADSYLGSFIVISISSLVSVVGILLLTLTSTLDHLKPAPCEDGSSLCPSPSRAQIGILYTSLALASVGVAGTRFTLATMGADQFENPKHQGIFFNWHFFTMYAATLVSVVGIVYIEDNVSWGLGFGLSVAANLIGLAAFVLGSRYYRLLKPQGSPFTGLACVLVAAFRKRKTLLSLKIEDYYQEPGTKLMSTSLTNSFKFLNHAALVTQGDKNSDGSIKNPWSLCTLQQVEDVKTLIRLSPLWSTGILLHTPIATQMSLVVLQALAMDRHLGPRFQIPAGSMMVFVMISTSLSLAVIDRFLLPAFHKLTRTSPTPLKRIGIGHVFTISSMAISALVESKRLGMARTGKLTGNLIVPMSVFWMVPQLLVVGAGEAFMFPGQVMFYYQEFPKAIKSTAAAMVALFIGIAFYLGTAVVDLIRKTTGWLPDGINDGRMDNVYWVLTVAGLVNFGYFLVCSLRYKYQNVEDKEVISLGP